MPSALESWVSSRADKAFRAFYESELLEQPVLPSGCVFMMGSRSSAARAPESLRLRKALSQRRTALRKWLKSSGSRCHMEQRHLIQGSAEREYWHWGYLIALSDILRALPKRASKTSQ